MKPTCTKCGSNIGPEHIALRRIADPEAYRLRDPRRSKEDPVEGEDVACWCLNGCSYVDAACWMADNLDSVAPCVDQVGTTYRLERRRTDPEGNFVVIHVYTGEGVEGGAE